MLRHFLVGFAIILYTLVMGSLAIFLSPTRLLPDLIAKLWAWLILRTSGVELEVKGLEKLDLTKPYVYMSNHSSHFDVASLTHILPRSLRFIAKEELKRIPVFGWAMYFIGHIFIDRSNQPKAFLSIDRGAERVKKGTPVLVFPEGTRSIDGSLQSFKKGGFVLAIKSGVPIVPISIRGSREVLPKGSLRVNSGKIKLYLGTPIETKEYSIDKKEGLMDRVRSSIEQGLKILDKYIEYDNNLLSKPKDGG